MLSIVVFYLEKQQIMSSGKIGFDSNCIIVDSNLSHCELAIQNLRLFYWLGSFWLSGSTCCDKGVSRVCSRTDLVRSPRFTRKVSCWYCLRADHCLAIVEVLSLLLLIRRFM